MRRIVPLIAALPLLLAAASAPVTAETEPVESEIARARADAKAAEADVQRFERAADKARDLAAKLAAERQAAASAIVASEAQISAADAQVRLTEAFVAERRQRLAERQAPVASLLAGIISMGRRPPLLSFADSSSLDEFVRVRALLDTTMPLIRQRSAALSGDLEQSRRLQASATSARNQLAAAHEQLKQRQQQFAKLEDEASRQAAKLGASAIGAGDVLTATGESEAVLVGEARERRSSLALAADLGALPPALARPGKAGAGKPSLAYSLPVAAPVTEGLGAVSGNGIRARGITLKVYAGAEVRAPADGTISFAGPFRRHDGVVIIDHGHGWMTLMTGVRTDLRKGDRVRIGDPLGRALGPLGVELSTNGTPVSAALIAGSSQIVSNGRKSG